MKRSLTLMLASLILVFALTACGGNNDTAQDSGQNENQSAVVGGDTANSGNQPNSSITTNDTMNDPTNGGSLMDDVGNAVENGLNDVENAMDDMTGNTAKARSAGSGSRMN